MFFAILLPAAAAVNRVAHRDDPSALAVTAAAALRRGKAR
jgi:hypothetical protein